MGIPNTSSVSQTPPSGDQANAVVTGAFTAAGQSASFLCWGPFNVSLWGAGGPNGNWNATVRLEKSYDGGATWIVVSVGQSATQAVWNTQNQDVAAQFTEPEKGVLYRLNCTVLVSSVNYRLSATGGAAISMAGGSTI